MRKQELASPGVKLGKKEQACERYSMCWATILKYAEASHAIVRNGRSTLINFTKLDSYFDAISGD